MIRIDGLVKRFGDLHAVDGVSLAAQVCRAGCGAPRTHCRPPGPWTRSTPLISFGREIEAVLLPAAALLGFAVLFSILGARFLRWA